MKVEDVIAEQMSKASKARTAESRKAGGVKAWQTRLANLRAKLNRKAISGNHAGENNNRKR